MSRAGVRSSFVGVGRSTFLVVEWSTADAGKLDSLSHAERQVAALVARGGTNEEIARARGRSPRTIANQLAAIMRKLGVGSRTGIARVMAGAT